MTQTRQDPVTPSLYRSQTACRVCGSDLPSPFLGLGQHPLANNLAPSREASYAGPYFPLELIRCGRCGLVQLSVVVAPEVLFGNYLYTPSQSATFRRHFDDFAAALADAVKLRQGDLAVDIGSNDGLLLGYLRERAGVRVLGIEPAVNLCYQANQDGILTINRFWNRDVALTIRRRLGKAKLITATNVFAHCDDWTGFLRAAAETLTEDGRLVIEVPALPKMLRDGTFDLIYHEHLSYPHLSPLLRLFRESDLLLERLDRIPIHGGSYRLFLRKGKDSENVTDLTALWDHLLSDEAELVNALALRDFKDRVYHARTAIRNTLAGFSSVAGYGAPAKATVLMNYLGFSFRDIRYVVDDSPLKQGKFIPGTGVEIISARDAATRAPVEAMVIWPWNIADDLVQKIQAERLARYAIVPLPEVRVLDLGEGMTENGREG